MPHVIEPGPGPALSFAAFRVEQIGRVAVVTLETPSLREPVAREVSDRLVALARPDGGAHYRQAVDLGRVRDAAGCALTGFLRAAHELDSLGGSLVLFAVPPALEEMVRRTSLRRHLRLAADVGEAVAIAEGRRSTLARWRRAG